MNEFMKIFRGKLIKGICVGVAIIALMLISQFTTDSNPLGAFKWYLIPVLFAICMLYGTGWVFAFNLIKRSWRRMLKVNAGASVWQAIQGRGMILGLFLSILVFCLGCFEALFVGNYFMIADYLNAKKNKAPISEKYKFDNDAKFDAWATTKEIIEYNEIKNGVSADKKLENRLNMDKVENGLVGEFVLDNRKRDKYKDEPDLKVQKWEI